MCEVPYKQKIVRINNLKDQREVFSLVFLNFFQPDLVFDRQS